VRDGHDLHYSPAADPDLALLEGDRLYAAGLEKLAESADLAAIRALADLISDCARAAAEARDGATSALWAATAERLGVTGFTPSQSAGR
jgi:hypothetical protein